MLLGLFAALAGASALQHSAIQHEPLYLYAGFQNLRHGVYEINAEDPPGLKQLAALPLLPLGLEDHMAPLEREYDASEAFLYRNTRPPMVILMAARLPFLLLGLLLGVAIFAWTRRLYGDAGALLALGLYATSPAMLAQTQFTNHDFGFAALAFLALYALWGACEAPTAARLLAAGIALGAALLTKFTALLLVPAVALIALRDARARGAPLGRRAAAVLAIWGLAALLVWAGYRFRVGHLVLPRSLWDMHGTGRDVGWNVPAPLFLWGAAWQVAHGMAGHVNFFAGRFGGGGWWNYYLLTLLYKLPVPVLVLLGVRAAMTLRRRDGAERFLLVVPVLVLLVFSLGKTQLGERYIIAAYPFAFVWLGGLARLDWAPRWRRAAAAALLAWLVVGVARIHPHYLMYFNEVAGGPRRGWETFVAGYDMGQDLGNLSRWVKARGISDIAVVCKGCELSLPYWDFPHRPFTCDDGGEWAAVSVYYRELLVADPACAWLRTAEPVDRVGYSILVYRRSDAAPAATAGSRAPGAAR